MSLLPHDTYVNAVRPLWAAAGSGGGGGGGSTLTSPASITPTAGAATLAVALGAGDAGAAAVTIQAGGDGGSAALNIAAGPNVYSLGCASTGTTLNLGVLPLQAGQGPALTYTPTTGILTLGDGLPTGAVISNNPLNVNTLLEVGQAGFGNTAALGALTANTSKLSQTLAAGGNISIGSSVANPSGLIVSDIARSGVVNFVQVSGSPGNTSLFLSGYQATVGECTIAPDIPSGGTLALGSSSVLANPTAQAIVITDAATTVNRLGGAPQTLMTAANINQGYSNTFAGPVGEGLYAICVCGASPSNAATRDAQMSTIAYVNPSGQIKMGGNATTTTPGPGVLDLFPIDSTTNMFLQYTGTGQGLVNVSIVAFKISGPIPGTF